VAVVQLLGLVMFNLVNFELADSVNDGTGPSTTLEPPQVTNALDEGIVIQGTISLNNASQVSGATFTTPTGYTLIQDRTQNEIRSVLYVKRSTGSETIPTITCSVSAEWSCTTAVVKDIDWAGGGYVQSNATGSNNTSTQDSTNLTTNATGSASVILCFAAVERRIIQGFGYPATRPQTVFFSTASTGTAEGIDNAVGLGADYMTARSSTFDGPQWRFSANGDNIAFNVEILVQNNIIPVQIKDFLVQAAPTNTFQTNMNWCREIIASGTNLDGTTMTTWNFDASSDIDTVNDTITITGHGMDESMVVNFSDNGNTAPGGLTNDTFYYVFPQDANTIKFCTVNEDTDAAGDYYYNVTTQRPIVDITSTGTGTMLLTEARMINAGQNVLDIFRPNTGAGGNVGSAPGDYIGDAGYNQNWVGTAQRFNSVFDATNEIINFSFRTNPAGRLDRTIAIFIDDTGDWINFTLWLNSVSPNNVENQYQFELGSSSIINKAYNEHGIFDPSSIRYLVIAVRGNNLSVNRFSSANSAGSIINLGGPLTLVRGDEASLSEIVQIAETVTDTVTQPSDLQITSNISINLGDGTTETSIVDSEKSIAFPPLADGTTTFVNYLENLGFGINASASDTIKLTNTQIGASLPFTFENNAASGATVDVSGNTYVFANATLDADITYNRQIFVGGQGITDNNAEIRNSFFIVNSDLGADNGMIDFTSTTDIETSTFELATGTTTGHAIKFSTTGTYNFTDIDFNSFGNDGTNTAAVFNNSGGSITINLLEGGTTPTVRNGAGASTTILRPVTVKVTARDAKDSSLINGAYVLLYADSGGDLPYQESVTITRSGSVATVVHSNHGFVTGDKVLIEGSDQYRYNRVQTITVTGASSYTFVVGGSPATPATGTITSTAIILDGTVTSGVLQDTNFNFTSNQPVVGRVRKGSASPFYKTGPLSGTITSSGLDLTAFLVEET